MVVNIENLKNEKKNWINNEYKKYKGKKLVVEE